MPNPACVKCGKSFSRPYDLKRHVATCSPKKCPKCGSIFHTLLALKTHVLTCSPRKCPNCASILPYLVSLLNHVSSDCTACNDDDDGDDSTPSVRARGGNVQNQKKYRLLSVPLQDGVTKRSIYQRPNNDIIMIANNQMYIFNYPHLHLIAQSNIHSVLSRSEGSGDVINAILHSNRGSTYIIYNRSFVNKVNECRGSLVTSTFIGDVSHLFPGIPRNVKTAFQHTNGRLYFKSNDLFYSYNDFIDSVSETIEDPSVLFNIVCNQNTILQQLQKLLNKLTMNLQLEEEAEEEEEEQE
uniref:C2H2-type domain-containing protein n=1 Tax=Rhodnius prolixus TaxID=13249 RepID=T1I540_RHOPR